MLKVRPARSTEVCISVENAPSSTKLKYEPDASFRHDDARYPGVIIEDAYSQKMKRLDLLAENYPMDSDTDVRVIVGLDIEYESLKLLLVNITESLQYKFEDHLSMASLALHVDSLLLQLFGHLKVVKLCSNSKRICAILILLTNVGPLLSHLNIT